MSEQPRRMLPTGIQTFREIRQNDCYYVDKTAYARRLVAEGKHWFLSRPRRFGKSLFLDTLKELFEGSEELFKNLAIHDGWDWSVRHPVLRISFSSGAYDKPNGLDEDIDDILTTIEDDAEVAKKHTGAGRRLGHVIRTLHQRAGQKVVVLVDEYDKPILDALEEPEIVAANRTALRTLYATIKDSDAHIRFSFLTGVTKFSKASLFSGANNVTDITLNRNYSGICGYTDTDLATVFAPELARCGHTRDEIRDWYNGYSWLGTEKLYNPYDILEFFLTGEFRPWWFETGTPEFLVKVLLSRPARRIDLERDVSSLDLLSRFDIGDIAPEALLFQTGYLTIARTKVIDGKTVYSLGYPNREVRENLNRYLLETMLEDPLDNDIEMRRAIATGDAGELETQIRLLFEGVPGQWHANNPMSQYEGWYASTMLAFFNCYGFRVIVENSTNQDRADMVLIHPDVTWIFEFKVVRKAGTGDALAQIRTRGYADKYRDGRRIILVGAEFSSAKRNLVRFETAEG